MDIILLQLDALSNASIIKRPSKNIKSPYVADIIINNIEFLGHTPSLGCCGLSESGCNVLVSKLGNNTKCDYRVELTKIETVDKITFVGIAPKLAEKITFNALNKQLIHGLSVSSISKEVKILNSRFDFTGKTFSGEQFILEVKSVPLAKNGIAYFPDGYRKKKDDTISPRALKHVNELKIIKCSNPKIRCILLFVIQRDDINSFQPSRDDPIYLDAIREAWLAGVEIKTLNVSWNEKGECIFISNTLPVLLYDNCKFI
jgi:DNA-binding sugar fermentation-stimulating protein